MHHCITYICISIFSKFGLVDHSKPCTQIYLQVIVSCINYINDSKKIWNIIRKCRRATNDPSSDIALSSRSS